MFDPSREDSSKYTRESMLRGFWYVMHVVLEDETTQKKGFIYLGYPKHFRMSQVDISLMKRNVQSFQDCIPVRLSAVHMIHPPYFFAFVWSLLKWVMKSRTRKRVNMCVGSDEHICERLEREYNMSKDVLPSEIGGHVVLAHEAWLEERARIEEDRN